MARTFVGIGFGPIQSGLFLLEAHRSGNFDRLVVAEIVPEVVDAVRQSAGRFTINVAAADGIRSQQVDGLQICDPRQSEDHAQLVSAIAAADEVATALPSAEFYHRGSPSPAQLLAEGFRLKLESSDSPRTVVYAAENNNRAAELLREAVLAELHAAGRRQLDDRVQFVNTVIGKMSGQVSCADQISDAGLEPLVAGCGQAVLVEEFNRILISQIKLPDFERGIEVFQEKPNLLPFEEAKLYGHNSTHALMGLLADRKQLTFMSEVSRAGLLEFCEQAFVEESGGALCQRHAGVDPLFTQEGWQEYVQDLLRRMTNPYLQDRVDRVIRDPQRKLAWDDRLVGTMRIALENGIEPRRYALGAAAAVELLLAEEPQQSMSTLLESVWGEAADSHESRATIIDGIRAARDELQIGYPVGG